MNELGKPPVVSMLELIMGMWISQSAHAIASLGIADHLKNGPKSVNELAKLTGTDPRALYRVMRTLASRGVFTESHGMIFGLTPMGELLREDVPGTLKYAAIMFNRPSNARSWEHAAYSIKTGKPAFDHVYGMDSWEYFRQNPVDWGIFNKAMTNLAATMHAAAIEACDFSGITSILDVGGGHGRLLAQILAKHPRLRGAVFDQPAVVEGAAATFRELGVADRAGAIGGDFFKEVPRGHDAIIMSHILHDWDDEKATAILRNCRGAIKDGGRLFILDAVITPGDEPDLGKIIDLEMLVMVGGKERTEAEFAALMRAGGFELRRVVPTRSSVSIVEGGAA